ncbi:MAG: sugar phosphate isomerase/epimerase [Lentisphaeria bacterium]|nr:sugar phosphate isomerase/epimerase [Lentisphaeria bacterium]
MSNREDDAMAIGIRTGCLKLDWIEGLHAAAALGFDTLEADVRPDYRNQPLWREEGREALRQALADSGCAMRSLCIGALWSISPASSDPAVRSQAVDLIADAARRAATVGARWILVPITPGGEDVDPETNVSRWLEALRTAAPVARDSGITLCVENVGRGCGRSAAELIRLVDGTASPAVQAYYDMGNAVAFGFDPCAEIRTLGARIAIVHVKDHADRLGDGDVPIAACLRALRAIGYTGDLVFETNPTRDPPRAATYNLGYLRGVLAALDSTPAGVAS